MSVRLEKFGQTIWQARGRTRCQRDHRWTANFSSSWGPSGCGKTTTLRMIAGLELPSEGRIFIDDRDVTTFEPRKRKIAMVFQDYGLYPHMTVFENIAFPLKIGGIDKAERPPLVEKVADALHITPLLTRRPNEISGGEKQRVSLARALVRNPSVFLMDEPLSNLDAMLRVTMRTEIKRLVSDLGITTVYVTHDQVEAMALATRIGVMNEGEMVQVDTPLNIYRAPLTSFVASFVGSPPMNMFDGQITGDGRLEVEPRFLGDAVSSGRLNRLDGESREVVVGVRPGHIDLRDSAAVGQAVINVVEPLGQDTYLYLTSEGRDLIAVTQRVDINVGDRVGIQVDDEKIHIFDKETGRNLSAAAQA